MRFVSIFHVLLYLYTFSFAQGAGIQFQAQTWEEAVQMARQENKLIFLDAYTSWCAPCKVMDEYVFTHELGGDLHNANFINLKMDMEKNMGPLFASRYGITSYPTFLYLSWDGTLVYKSEGYQNIEKLVSESRRALEPYRLERALNDRFKGGDRIPDFLYNLTYYKMDKNDPSYKDLIPMYLAAEKDWLQPLAIHYIFDHVTDFDSDMFIHMSENKLSYSEIVGAEAFNKKYNNFIKTALHNNGDPVSLQRREHIYKIAYPSIADRMITEYKLDYYSDLGDDASYAETAFYYFTEYASDDTEAIADAIPLFEQHLTSAESKQYVRNWYEQQARQDRSATSLLKMARYSLTDGDFDKAKSLAKEAKKMAKKAKEDQTTIKEFLKELKAAQKARKK